jgi:hypothetical protein
MILILNNITKRDNRQTKGIIAQNVRELSSDADTNAGIETGTGTGTDPAPDAFTLY